MQQTSAGAWRYSYATEAPEMQSKIDRFRLAVAGRTVIDEARFTPGREVLAPLAIAPAAVLRETRRDATYTAVRVTPDWSRLGVSPEGGGCGGGEGRTGARAPRACLETRPGARRLLVLVDTSRSSLESRSLALEATRQLLDELQPQDQLLVTAADISCRDHATAFVPASAQTIREALAFLRGIEPDGASDLGAALRHAGARLRSHTTAQSQVVYVGDGIPTWGETDEKALRALARHSLGGTPLHAVVLGRGANMDFVSTLAGELGGRTARPRGPAQVRRFAQLLRLASELPALRGATLTSGADDVLFPRQPTTLFPGDSLVALIRTPAGKPAPAHLTLTAVFDGRTVTQSFGAGAAAPTRHVARRWAARQIAELEGRGGAKEEIVKLSIDHGVMSRHTSFLVLESEEAYRRYSIERKNAQAQAQGQAPQVSGGDLESLRRRQTSLTPNEIQPGDPEIRVPAPADALAVVVVLPFGETKIARYEPALRVWTARFLVDKSTPDGTYQVIVRITHRDGRSEILTVPYVIDTQSPMVKVTLHRTAQRGTYELRARQVSSAAAVRSSAPDSAARLVELRLLAPFGRSAVEAQFVQDARRVEVQLPDGRILALRTAGPGTFSGLFRPRQPLAGAATLRVIAVDRALNKSVFSTTLEVPR